MAEESNRTEEGRFARLDQVKDQATYNRVRAAQIAGKDEEEEADAAEEPKQPTGNESQREYNRLRNEQKNGGGFQKRIDSLVKQREASKKEAEELKSRLEAYERGEQPGAQPAEPTEEEKTNVQKKHDRFHWRLEEARKRHEDFEELQKAGANIKITNAMAGQIVDLDNGAEVAVYLARHPEIARDLHRDPRAAQREIDYISRKLEEEAKQDSLAEKIANKMPKYEPIRPVAGSNKSSVPLDKMSMADYKRARAAGRTR